MCLCMVIRLEIITGQDRWSHSLVTQDITWKDLQTECAWKMEIGAKSCQHVRKLNPKFNYYVYHLKKNNKTKIFLFI